MFIRTPQFKHLRAILIFSIVVIVCFYTILIQSRYKNEVDLLKKSVYSKDKFIYELSDTIDTKYPVLNNYERKDWHDYEFMKYEASREGPGEKGEAYVLTDPEDIKLNKELFEIEGLYVVVSDKISVNRSVPDVRIEQCKTKTYLKHLPSTSVIVIFHNEYWSILLRTIHALVNRTPKELLHEIIMVNDKSTKTELYEPLQRYVDYNFKGVVKILNLPERKGLIVTRMEGAKIATGEVLVFLDSHIEVNVNWLPPLIEPIAINPKVGTCPIVDNFSHDTFKYERFGDGSRGVFDWNFIYHWLPRRKQDMIEPDKPFSLPIMLGCAFAINRQYYWDLGAYDEELMIWNGENYELSFKLHLCGGELLEVPCSRVAHTFRRHNEYRKKTGVDFVARNFKRIAEVWLDDYKEKLYSNEPERYAKIDPGDLTKPKAIRKNLKCKPFQYYLDYVAPDMLERYPYGDLGVFAKGAIISEAKGTGNDDNKKFCVDTLSKSTNSPLGLYPCQSDVVKPATTQDFILTWHRSIKINNNYDTCFDTYQTALFGCHYAFGHQYFKYDLETHQIINPSGADSLCLTANIESKNLTMIKCDTNNMNQKWDWGYKNITALQNWDTFGVKVPS